MQSKAVQGRNPIKLLVLVSVVLAMLAALFLLRERLSLDYVAEQEQALREFQQAYPWFVYVLAFALYVIVTGLSLPGATVLTLVYAWFFGFVPALVLVSFASTMGATLAFLLSRYLFRDAIQHRFGDRLKSFNEALDREGAFYLFTLRLIPAVPFFVINAVMGLTNLRARTFWWVSQVGMLAGTCVYVYAGASIPRLEQLADPSQLRAADLINPETLIQRVGATSSDPVGQQLRRSLTPAQQSSLDEWAQAKKSLTLQQREKLIVVLNSAIARPDFGLQPEWATLFQGGNLEKDGNERAGEKELTRINRMLLVRAFPQSIKTPGRLVSPNLLVAFCLLGLFPLVAKRLMQRWRGQRKDETNASRLSVDEA